ncbi:protein NETWORKED 1D [Prunus yedoensis var. nudiflora]|uniref:Protein NETWORKED 1D n=1 Tax=Prunus yedoensis var. nudiflora TaxID=2094558 RepID=A0A314UYQ8_PRUYE|nr:protein NETWORKED 1D [Prunus yedoensis var. nudiflora]
MIKHRWRELAKSFGNHVDPEKTEQLKRTKSEIENNVTRIFKLIKNEEQGKKEDSRKDSKNESELVGLIENFYQQYQSLYALYDHLVGESGRIVRGKKERKELADSIKHEGNTENSEVADLKQKLVSRNEEKEAINSEYMEALRKIRRTDNIDKDLKNEMDERVRELSALVEAHEAHGNESSARVKELEGQLTGFKIELESLCCQKRDLEAWKEGKAAEAKQLGEKNIGLHARVLELEIGLKGKEDEISDLQKKLKENEDSSTSKVSDLMAQASNLQVEVNSLRAQKGELEQKMVSKKNESLAQVKGLRDQINGVQKELKSLRQHKTESEAQLDKKNKEISKHLLQIENLKEELNRKDTVEMKMMDDRQCLLERMKELEMQTDSRRSQKKNLEKQIKNRNQENNKLRQENEGLLSKIFELERTLNERGDEFYALCRECGEERMNLLLNLRI